MDIKKPYSLDDISKRPYAVVISLLIGLLLISVSYNVIVARKKEEELQSIYEKWQSEKDKRIIMYENMIFYKGQVDLLQAEKENADSVLKQKTEPFVNKIFNNAKK